MSLLRRINCAEANDRAPFFVLGALEAREWAEVREHLATCGQPHPEFVELGGVVPYLGEALDPLEPPPSLRQRVLEAVEADVRAGRRDDSAAERLVTSIGSRAAERPEEAGLAGAVTIPSSLPAARAVPAVEAIAPAVLAEPRAAPRRRTALGWRLLSIAAVLVVGVLAGWNLLLQGQASEARHRADVLRDAIVARADPSAATATLSGTDAAPGASGFAVLRSAEQGYIVVHGLSSAPAGSTYEAWYLSGGSPRPAGLLRVHDDGLAVLEVETDEPVDAVAVTLEPEGGSDAPTLPVLVEGSMVEGTGQPG
ncbi:MAG TPA: anti-sigma factor [Candidatus Limnocylindrales bacterium]|nr:anti-sigma factor [Candidatus Limnocylindrales bacterium]